MADLETRISRALTDYIEVELRSAVQDQICASDIAGEIDLDDVVSHLDLDDKFDEAIANWLDKNFHVIVSEYRNTAEHIVRSMAEAQMLAWLIDNRYRFEPLHRRCWRWLKSINWKFWRKKNEQA